jgi:hypothetical protein
VDETLKRGLWLPAWHSVHQPPGNAGRPAPEELPGDHSHLNDPGRSGRRNDLADNPVAQR